MDRSGELFEKTSTTSTASADRPASPNAATKQHRASGSATPGVAPSRFAAARSPVPVSPPRAPTRSPADRPPGARPDPAGRAGCTGRRKPEGQRPATANAASPPDPRGTTPRDHPPSTRRRTALARQPPPRPRRRTERILAQDGDHLPAPHRPARLGKDRQQLIREDPARFRVRHCRHRLRRPGDQDRVPTRKRSPMASRTYRQAVATPTSNSQARRVKVPPLRRCAKASRACRPGSRRRQRERRWVWWARMRPAR
jgi:hypothetical protein